MCFALSKVLKMAIEQINGQKHPTPEINSLCRCPGLLQLSTKINKININKININNIVVGTTWVSSLTSPVGHGGPH